MKCKRKSSTHSASTGASKRNETNAFKILRNWTHQQCKYDLQKNQHSGGTTKRIQSFMIILSAFTLVQQKYFSSCQQNEDGVRQSKVFVDGHNVRDADTQDHTSVHHPVSRASRNVQGSLGRHRSVSQSKTRSGYSVTLIFFSTF